MSENYTTGSIKFLLRSKSRPKIFWKESQACCNCAYPINLKMKLISIFFKVSSYLVAQIVHIEWFNVITCQKITKDS
ncbi:unnamed protein product [Moneuplotes crassus]|uniref:Uncharacterized protein n=1 Tax=Euplotes crassus TaxID=5936 RepID=A0AAD2D1S0_EUPCR|nr:unnamed protein product [Moneuplotes crassus]